MTTIEKEHPVCVAVIGGCVWAPELPDALSEAVRVSESDWTRRLDPLSIKAVQCMSEARLRACLPKKCEVPNREGVCVGTVWGAQQTRIRYAKRLVSHGISGTNPIDFPDSIDGAPAAHVALQGGFQGPSFTFVGGAECAHRVLVTAARQLVFGFADRMHVVLGDLRDCTPRTRVSGPVWAHQHPAAAEPSDLVMALVLERSAATPGHDFVYLVGYESGGASPDCSRHEAGAPEPDRSSGSGAKAVAGAWLGLTDPMGHGPFACQYEALPNGLRRCLLTNTQWPLLALVRTEN